MNTYKITTNAGFTNYLGTSISPEQFVKEMYKFDYDAYHFRCGGAPKWDMSNGIVTEIELFWCGTRQEQVREVLIKA